MSSLSMVAKRGRPDEGRGQPWRAELDALGAILAESSARTADAAPGDALRARIAAIVAEEAGDRLSEALARRIAERVATSL
jgi:hypothetical protein